MAGGAHAVNMHTPCIIDRRHIRRHLFYLLDYVTRQSEKLRFAKKKKKKKKVRRQIGKKFLLEAYFGSSFKKKTFILLICQIFYKYNTKVLSEH